MALSGDVDSQFLMGKYYHENQDMLKAFKWYRRSALNGSIESLDSLIHIYYYGEDLCPNTDMIPKKAWKKLFSICTVYT